MITQYDTKFSGESVKIEMVYSEYFNITHWNITINAISAFGRNQKSIIMFLQKQCDLEHDNAEMLYNACVQFINLATNQE